MKLRTIISTTILTLAMTLTLTASPKLEDKVLIHYTRLNGQVGETIISKENFHDQLPDDMGHDCKVELVRVNCRGEIVEVLSKELKSVDAKTYDVNEMEEELDLTQLKVRVENPVSEFQGLTSIAQKGQRQGVLVVNLEDYNTHGVTNASPDEKAIIELQIYWGDNMGAKGKFIETEVDIREGLNTLTLDMLADTWTIEYGDDAFYGEEFKINTPKMELNYPKDIPYLSVDGKLIYTTMEIEDGRTLVPLRAIFQAMGAKVEYNSSTGVIEGKLGNTIVVLTIGSKEAYVNGNKLLLDVPARVTGGNTIVPLRFIGESLGAEVHSIGNAVIINSK